jgi:hypothetical protein
VTDAGCPEHVRAFVDNFIDSVVQLEMLLLLFADRHRAWTAQESARELRVEAAWVEDQFAQLCARGLLRCTSGPPVSYQYSPATPELDAAIADLAREYNDRRVAIIALIYSKPSAAPSGAAADPLTSFADAFRLRKDKGNG